MSCLALGWGNIKDVTGSLQENMAILVSGAPNCIEGKLLSVIKLVNDEGKQTSTGEAKASAAFKQIQAWGIAYDILAFIFDNTASNSGNRNVASDRINTRY